MNVVLGITGSVAAYKTPWLVRDLRRAGHDVRVVMTPSAAQFVTPLALEAVSTAPVIVDPYDRSIQHGGSWHVHLAQWAHVMLIAPCSATTLARLAYGLCDTSVMTVALSLPATTPLVVAPAMDADMWLHAATRHNATIVAARPRTTIVPPASGPLASGLEGAGRLPELDVLVDAVGDATAAPRPSWHGLDVLVTAGPTHEAIDAVRFVANASSGTMGFALAAAAARRGANVRLVAGPVGLPTPPNVTRVDVVSAREMAEAVLGHISYDVAIMAAAVADFTPARTIDGKLKKETTGQHLTLDLERTTDILATLGQRKRPEQTLVGFALEHTDLLTYATDKLQRKRADMIVANLAGQHRSGFGTPDNTITILTRDGRSTPYPPMSKRDCADIILDTIFELRSADHAS